MAMRFSRYRALKRLRKRPSTLRELAQGMGTDTPAATVLIDDPEARSLVARRPLIDDRASRWLPMQAGHPW